MSPENTKNLFTKYRKLFRGSKLPITENLMGFGFECGDGWYGLIDELCDNIQEILKADKGAKWAKDFIVVQVKEKFGGLRFYISGAPDEVHNLVADAEEQSLQICEACGAPGEVFSTGWIFTRCESCFEKILRERGIGISAKEYKKRMKGL